jgi:hypothetical protein
MSKETRNQKPEVALIYHSSFGIHLSFLILVSSFWPHTTFCGSFHFQRDLSIKASKVIRISQW